MSKKKNTLQDLDEFLKQQAAALVTPSQLADKIEEPGNITQASSEERITPLETSSEKILTALKSLAGDRKKLYDIIVKSVESQDQKLPEDMMLINTALYLKSGENWKEAIRKYWKDR